jgi:hypothetical protein
MIFLNRRQGRERSRYCSIDVRNPGSGGGGATATSGWWPFFPHISGNLNQPEGNTIWVIAVTLPSAWTLNKIWFNITTADAGSTMDAGVYSRAGSLLASLGGYVPAATGTFGVAVAGAPVALAAGQYMWAMTSNSATLNVALNNSAQVAYANLFFGTSSGGVLPASVSAYPGDSPGSNQFWMGIS